MTDCIFCRLVNREVPAEIVYEDQNFLAFLDIRPQAPGHTLVIPKPHYRWVWDVPNAGDYFLVAQKIAHAQQKAFQTESIISKIVGEEVPHAHIWLIPNPQNAVGDKHDLPGNAAKLKAELGV